VVDNAIVFGGITNCSISIFQILFISIKEVLFIGVKVNHIFLFFIRFTNNLLSLHIIYAKMNIGSNIKQIRELKNYSQEYMARELEISQPAYARIENGTVIPKIDRLQRIADILEIDISFLLNTTNVFNLIFNATANQSGYINNQSNYNIDIEMVRKIIQEEMKNM
jgi:transcriptional regulator with XRE-family HTH domain